MSRVAVVTGGGSGIGEAICHHLAARGNRIAVLDLDGAAAERVAAAVRAGGGEALAATVDVTDRTAVDAALATVRSDFGPVEILVTSAGMSKFTPFTEISLADWNKVVEVNLTGTFHCIQSAIPDMIASKWGRIVTISSSSAQRGSPRMGHYAAAKAGVIALTKTLAREFGRCGITANSIPPSSIDTPMARNSQSVGDLPSAEAMANALPVGRLGTADDIAAACAFLCSDEAGFITGQVLGVNGGGVV